MNETKKILYTFCLVVICNLIALIIGIQIRKVGL
ncbi:Uncharacterised protein [Enterococcus mundtii]|nr:Uncharacterised protein [Enterococcus mundtii]